jgi:hypothetical protein
VNVSAQYILLSLDLFLLVAVPLLFIVSMLVMANDRNRLSQLQLMRYRHAVMQATGS